MSKKGITSVTLAIAVVVLLMLVMSISVSLTYSINNAKKMVFAKEIYNIQSIVTEYIQKENVLPAKEAIQLEIKDTDQFDARETKNSDGKVLLNVLDLAELDIKNTTYGNGVLGKTSEEKKEDVYAVSQTTGKVYYIAGFEMNNKKYYTLTDELINMIDKKQNLNIGESTILFMPDILGWTNQGVTVRVSVPDEYTIDSVITDNTNIECIAETIDGIEYWSVNKSKVAQSYTVTVNYTKNGTSETISYTTKFDNVAPVISKDTNIANTAKSIKGLNAIDNESGIKHFKYVEGVVENDYNAATYMNEFGKKIKSGSLKAKQRAIYTLYAEDKAGNYRIIHVDSEGERAYFTIENDTGTNEFILNNAYELSLLNYRIYGNSVQNGTPSVETPIEIESVGDKTVNLFSYKTLQESGYIQIVDEKTGEFNWINASDIPEIKIDAKENTQYTISADVKAGSNQMIHISVYYTDGTYKTFSANCNTETFTHITGFTEANKTVDYVKFGGSNGLIKGTVFKKLQIVEGRAELEYEPYDKYKITIIDNVKNLISGETLVKQGFEKLSENEYVVNNNAIVYKKKIYENFTKKEGQITISYSCKVILSNNMVGAFPAIYYTDGTSVSIDIWKMLKENEYFDVKYTSNKDKIVDYVCWSYQTGGAVTYIKNLQIEYGSEASTYEPGIENRAVIYLDEPLRKIGSYADYIDFKSGTIVRKIGETVLNGTEEVTVADIYGKKSFLVAIEYFKNALIENDTLNGFSTHFVPARRSQVGNSPSSYYMATQSYVFNYNGINTDIDEFKAFLTTQKEQGKACKVDYVLNTPSETPIELPEIITTSGYSRITIGTKVAPSETNIRYYGRVQ